MSLGAFYLGLLVLGFAYALVAGLAGWLSDLGDGDVQVDASGHLEAGNPHPISGTTIATFVTGFGGGGVVSHYYLRWPPLGSLAAAVATGLVVAAAAFAVLELIFRNTQAGSEFAVEESVGREAEVITTVPAGGVGEVAFLARGQREQAAARASDGAAIPKGSVVVVEKVMGSTFYVRRKG
jgi:hypothetical protein